MVLADRTTRESEPIWSISPVREEERFSRLVQWLGAGPYLITITRIRPPPLLKTYCEHFRRQNSIPWDQRGIECAPRQCRHFRCATRTPDSHAETAGHLMDGILRVEDLR